MKTISRIIERIFPRLREVRIDITVELEGEDAVSAEDKAWYAARCKREEMKGGAE